MGGGTHDTNVPPVDAHVWRQLHLSAVARCSDSYCVFLIMDLCIDTTTTNSTNLFHSTTFAWIFLECSCGAEWIGVTVAVFMPVEPFRLEWKALVFAPVDTIGSIGRPPLLAISNETLAFVVLNALFVRTSSEKQITISWLYVGSWCCTSWLITSVYVMIIVVRLLSGCTWCLYLSCMYNM